MSATYTLILDLAREVEPPQDGILTRTLFNDETVKAVIFGFGQGEELSEHTASMPAILHFVTRRGDTYVRRQDGRGSAGNMGPHAERVETQRADEDTGHHVASVVEDVGATARASSSQLRLSRIVRVWYCFRLANSCALGRRSNVKDEHHRRHSAGSRLGITSHDM
jgi:hypothetical protein